MKIRISGNPEFRISENPDFWISVFPKIRISGLQIQNPWHGYLFLITEPDSCFSGIISVTVVSVMVLSLSMVVKLADFDLLSLHCNLPTGANTVGSFTEYNGSLPNRLLGEPV